VKKPTSNQSTETDVKFISISSGMAKNGGLGTCPLGAGAS
jgi:hypothetical protein